MDRRVLVTAGNTAVLIDQVRALTNIFRGRTGHAIAAAFAERGYAVTLLASDPNLPVAQNVNVRRYRTFDELAGLMEEEVRGGGHGTVVHSAAVSDYRPVATLVMNGEGALVPVAAASQATKIPSGHEELYLKLVPTPKLVDLVREPWGFRGVLVKFKLQVGMTDAELVEIARRSLRHSQADLIVANCLEWSRERAYILDREGRRHDVPRRRLAGALVEAVECLG